jgi:PAS domain S-box-containing protein
MTLKSKINGIELGDHLCLVYDNEKDKLYTTILFIIDGLKKEELVFVLNEDEEEIIRILGEIIDVRRFIEKEQLIFLSKEEIYLKDGFFDANKMLETIAELDEKALIEGYKGLRVVGNANWVLTHPKLESFLEFEAKLNKLLPLTKSIFLCLFDERKFNPGLLLRILQVHPKLISGKEVRENLNYLPPDKFLKKLKAGNATLKKLIDRKLMIEFEEMEEKFRMLFESSFEAVMIFKGDRLIACNPKAIELFGFKDFQQLLGKRIYDLFKENSLEYRVNAASRGEPQFFELGFFRTDGDKIDLEVSLTKVSDKLMMIARDITERKKMEEELREREERYRLLVDSSIDAIITINSKAEILTWNRGAEKIFGYRAEEVIGKPLTILIPERFRERFRKRFNQIYSVFKSEFEYPIGRYMETIGLRKNGEEFPAEMSYYIWRSGDKIFFTSIVRDISERNRLEQSLRESEKKYRELWENAGDVLFIIDLEGNFLEANRTARELFGYNKEEVKKLNLRDVVDENYLPVIYQEIEKIINSKRSEILNLEVLCYTKDGKAVWMESRAKPIIDKGRIIAIQGIARDITERKKMEEAIKESEEKFRALAEKSLVGIYLIQDGVFKYVNPKMAELWGYSVDELIGRNPLEFIHPEDKEIVKRNIEKRIKGEADSIHYRLRMVRKDGSIRINEVYGSRTFYSGKPAVLGTLVDITDEERRRKKLEEYKRFYQNAQDLFFILDGKGRFVDINPKYAEMLGYSKEELIGHTARKLIDPDELDRVRENFKKVMRGQSVRYEAKAVAKDGRVYVMDVTIWPVFNKGKVVGA